LSDNPIHDVRSAVEQLQVIMPNVTDLQISLFKEQDVDFIMKSMPQLEYLNNLPIERDLSKSTTLGDIPDEFDEKSGAVHGTSDEMEITEHDFKA